MFDPAIKLFGKTIPLPDSTSMLPPLPPPSVLLTHHQVAPSETSKSEAGESFKEESCKPDKSSTLDNPKKDAGQTPNQENKAIMNVKPEKDEAKTDCDGHEKALKKPDKIIRCPRCNSLETKFCYYNNYNVNQPRHFCKKCQRYWTAGGTMRNVPVGAGRRKNKHIASHYCHTMSSDGHSTTLVDTSESDNHQANSCDGLSTPLGTCNGNGSVFKFGSDGPLCESMSTILTLGDQNEPTDMDVSVSGENREEVSFRGSSTPASTCKKIEVKESVSKMDQPGMPGCFDGPALPPNPMQYCPSSPWAYPWNSGWNSLAAMAAGHWSSEFFYGMNAGNLKQVQLASTPMVATPAFSSPSTPFPVAPTSYWSCVSGGWASGAWNMAWNGSIGTQSPSTPSSQSGCSDSGSPTLGKHSRDANTPGEGGDESEKCLWVPKTLRIDDPGEAAKSSIWATLGIKPGQNAPILKGGIFRAFQPKKELNDNVSDANQILQVNPAAFSRSQTFQESM